MLLTGSWSPYSVYSITSIFDEFHVFQAPQVVAVINALLFIHEVTGATRPRKFVFLSATPEPLLLEYLQRAGLRYTVIEGQYTHGPHNPDPQRWRRILHGCTLDMAAQTAEEWVQGHLEDTLLPFFLERRPGAKGAIIVNSVAAALRLVERLRPVLCIPRPERRLEYRFRRRRAPSNLLSS